jgi:predicted DNA-binding transcriptional regulator YafY
LPRRNVHPQVLRNVVAALNTKKTLKIFYQSMSSDEAAWRLISPHAFAFDGHRWHVRAYCHNGNHYKDFLVSRIQEAERMQEDAVSGDNDAIWHEFFTLKLKPHPELSESQAQAVALDYDMKDMKLDIKIRLALLYYYLKRLGLEDRDGSGKKPREQHVVVANKEETEIAFAKTQSIT